MLSLHETAAPEGVEPSSHYNPSALVHEDAGRAWLNAEILEILRFAGFRPRLQWFALKAETRLKPGQTVLVGTQPDIADELGVTVDFVGNRLRESRQLPCLLFITGGRARRLRDSEGAEKLPVGAKVRLVPELGEMVYLPGEIDFRPLYQHRARVEGAAERVLFERGHFTGGRLWREVRWTLSPEERAEVWGEAVKVVPLPSPQPKMARTAKATTKPKAEPAYSRTALLREVSEVVSNAGNRDAAVGAVAAWALSELPPEAVAELLRAIAPAHVISTDTERATSPERRFCGDSPLIAVVSPEVERDEEEDAFTGAAAIVPDCWGFISFAAEPTIEPDTPSRPTSKGSGTPIDDPVEALSPSSPIASEVTGPTVRRARPSSVTVAGFAEHIGLPETFLRECGVTEWADDTGREYVAVQYYRETGELLGIKQRSNLIATPRYVWVEGSARLYGLHRLEDARSRPALVLVEGESDTLTFWYAGLPCLGVSGASNFAAIELRHLAGIASVIVARDNDDAGVAFASNVAEHLQDIGYRGGCYSVRFDSKDANAEFKRLNGDPAAFRRSFGAAWEWAVDLST